MMLKEHPHHFRLVNVHYCDQRITTEFRQKKHSILASDNAKAGQIKSRACHLDEPINGLKYEC